MEHRKYRVSKQTHDKMMKRQSILDVVKKQFGNGLYNVDNHVNAYMVNYELVKTKDLVDMLQRLTICDNFTNYVKRPSASMINRLNYLDELKSFVGIDMTDPEFTHLSQLVVNQQFLSNLDYYISKLRKELATREHVPTKKDGKIVRKLKAQGKYIID